MIKNNKKTTKGFDKVTIKKKTMKKKKTIKLIGLRF